MRGLWYEPDAAAEGIDQVQSIGTPPRIKKALRGQARRVDETRREMVVLERERAWFRSEVDLETPLGRYFEENYKGESHPPAIRAEVERIGTPLVGQRQQPEDDG